MYPPDCILAPRSCQALPPKGRLWPSDDDDHDNGDGDDNHDGDDGDDDDTADNRVLGNHQFGSVGPAPSTDTPTTTIEFFSQCDRHVFHIMCSLPM